MPGRSVLDEASPGAGVWGTSITVSKPCSTTWATLTRPDDMDKILERFGTVPMSTATLATRLEAQGSRGAAASALSDARIDGDVGALSGSWKMRRGPARVLLEQTDVLPDG